MNLSTNSVTAAGVLLVGLLGGIAGGALTHSGSGGAPAPTPQVQMGLKVADDAALEPTPAPSPAVITAPTSRTVASPIKSAI